MARKSKAGLDYRPLNLEKSTAEKLIRYDCGALRMAILTDLTSKIYRTNGYYITWNESEMKVFAMEECFDMEDVTLVVDKALEHGYFDAELYETYGVLTSSEIQEIYLFACEKKSRIEMIFEYISVDIRSFSQGTRKRLYISDADYNRVDAECIGFDCKTRRAVLINAPENDNYGIKGELFPEKGANSGIISPEMPQIKENKIKENKNKSNVSLFGERNKLNSNEENMSVSPLTPKKEMEKCNKYGEYKNVILSDKDLSAIKDEFPYDWSDRIERLSEYMASSGKEYKSHLATLRSWSRMDGKYGSSGTSKNIYEDFMDNRWMLRAEEEQSPW